MFTDREEAAHRLAEALQHYRGRNPLVLAIPRGAVPMARILTEELGGDLDVVLVHKLGAPGNPEFAIGAVGEDGTREVSEEAHRLGISQDYIAEEAERQLQTLRQRRQRYTPVREPLDPSGRNVIVVDDGIATGATMQAALKTLRPRGPQSLVAAVAVAPPDAAKRLESVADEVVCLQTPYDFFAVGQFFRNFEQVSDDDVVAILQGYGSSRQGDEGAS